MEPQELVTNIGLPISINYQIKFIKDIKSQVTKSQCFQDVLLSYVLTDTPVSQSSALQRNKSVNKPNKSQILMIKSLLIKLEQLLTIIHTWLNKIKSEV